MAGPKAEQYRKKFERRVSFSRENETQGLNGRRQNFRITLVNSIPHFPSFVIVPGLSLRANLSDS